MIDDSLANHQRKRWSDLRKASRRVAALQGRSKQRPCDRKADRLQEGRGILRCAPLGYARGRREGAHAGAPLRRESGQAGKPVLRRRKSTGKEHRHGAQATSLCSGGGVKPPLQTAKPSRQPRQKPSGPFATLRAGRMTRAQQAAPLRREKSTGYKPVLRRGREAPATSERSVRRRGRRGVF